MGIEETAAEYFDQGFNCAESVLKSLVEAFGIECSCVPRIATGFGAGIGRHAETCGAVVGAVMAFGLIYGREDAGDLDAKLRTYDKVSELLTALKKEIGSIIAVQDNLILGS